MSEPSPAELAASAGVRDRLDASARVRRAREEARRAEAAEAGAPPAQSPAAVSASLDALRAGGEAALAESAAAASAGDAAGACAAAGRATDAAAALDAATAAAALFLPAHAARAAADSAAALRARAAAAGRAAAPRPAFSFARPPVAAPPPPQRPAAPAAAPPPPQPQLPPAGLRGLRAQPGAPLVLRTLRPSDLVSPAPSPAAPLSATSAPAAPPPPPPTDFVVEDCADAVVVLLGPLRALTLRRLRNVTLLAFVAGPLYVEHLGGGCVVHACAHQARVHDCGAGVALCLRVRSRPVVERTRGATFSPLLLGDGCDGVGAGDGAGDGEGGGEGGCAELGRLAAAVGLGPADAAAWAGRWRCVDDFDWIRAAASPHWAAAARADGWPRPPQPQPQQQQQPAAPPQG